MRDPLVVMWCELWCYAMLPCISTSLNQFCWNVNTICRFPLGEFMSTVLNCICVTFGFCCHAACCATLLSSITAMLWCCVGPGVCVCTCESRVGGEGWISLFWARAPDSRAANKGGKRPGEGERLWVSIGTPSAKIWVWEGGRTRWRKMAVRLCNWRLVLVG